MRELFALSVDYDPSDKATQMFFAQTMGLTNWKGDIVRKGDVIIAKNYLHKEELDSLNRLVNVFLESAELRVKDKQTLTMDFWR